MNFESSDCFLNEFLRQDILGLEFIVLYWQPRGIGWKGVSLPSKRKLEEDCLFPESEASSQIKKPAHRANFFWFLKIKLQNPISTGTSYIFWDILKRKIR